MHAFEDFGGRLAVVTGAASGIGRDLMLALASKGANVAACDLNEGKLQTRGSNSLSDRRVTAQVRCADRLNVRQQLKTARGLVGNCPQASRSFQLLPVLFWNACVERGFWWSLGCGHWRGMGYGRNMSVGTCHKGANVAACD